jgi:transcriptional regulator GlxA family with amidase domain
MERARELLAHSSLPLADVGRRCGFPDVAHFSRRFKQLCGLAPGRFRRAAQE